MNSLSSKINSSYFINLFMYNIKEQRKIVFYLFCIVSNYFRFCLFYSAVFSFIDVLRYPVGFCQITSCYNLKIYFLYIYNNYIETTCNNVYYSSMYPINKQFMMPTFSFLTLWHNT